MRVIESGAISPGVSLDEFKRSVHISLEDADDDMLLGAILESAEAVVATATGRPFTSQVVQFELPRATWRRWWFPVLPVTELTSLEVRYQGGDWRDVPLTGAWVDLAHEEPQLCLGDGWLGHKEQYDVLRITAKVGGPDTRMLAKLKQATFLIAKDWFDNGLAVEEMQLAKVAFGARALLKQSRYRRPFECE